MKRMQCLLENWKQNSDLVKFIRKVAAELEKIRNTISAAKQSSLSSLRIVGGSSSIVSQAKKYF